MTRSQDNPIVKTGKRSHSKASERYVDVVFRYEGYPPWDGSIPIEYRRTGIDLVEDDEVNEYLAKVYEHCHPGNWDPWREEQAKFWESKPRADVTKEFFDGLTSFGWTCGGCELPANPNPARRIQDIKEFGYTLATDTSRHCDGCGQTRTHFLMVPLPRGGITGYETWSPALRVRIVRVLGSHDAYEHRSGNPAGLLPDHKFPEIRWGDETRRERESLEVLSDEEIRQQFQLMSNQRNQQKREVCRGCYQTDARGTPFGISFFYAGNGTWPTGVPKRDNDAERGCVGCGWYDLERWRTALNEVVTRPKAPRG